MISRDTGSCGLLVPGRSLAPLTRPTYAHLPTPGRRHEGDRRGIQAGLTEIAGQGRQRPSWDRRRVFTHYRGPAEGERVLAARRPASLRCSHGSLLRHRRGLAGPLALRRLWGWWGLVDWLALILRASQQVI